MDAPVLKEFEDSILLLGGGIGWIGSLALDLLINTYSPKSVGTVFTECVESVSCNNVFDGLPEGSLVTSLELYTFSVDNTNFTLLQQRAPIKKNRNREYVEQLVPWFEQCKFKSVVVLRSIDAECRVDDQLFGPQTRYLSWNANSWSDTLKSKGYLQLEEHTVPFHVREGSFLLFLSEKCSKQGIPLMFLMRFCSNGEGNAVGTTCELLQMLHSIAPVHSGDSNFDLSKLKRPSAWRFLFGFPLDPYLGIY